MTIFQVEAQPKKSEISPDLTKSSLFTQEAPQIFAEWKKKPGKEHQSFSLDYELCSQINHS